MTAVPLTQHDPGVRAELDGFVATVTLDRPGSKNACTGDMWVAVGAAFREVAHSGARVAVLTGANGDFCAGADLMGGGGAMAAAAAGRSRRSPQMIDNMRVIAESVLAVHSCPIPVVAQVEGSCVGAGFGLALACDLLYCAEDSRFSAIFAKRGLSLDFGTSWLLRERVGTHKAKELAFTAKLVSGLEAVEIGFANAAVPAAELGATVQELVDTLAGGPPIALSMIKRQIDGASGMSLAQALEVEALSQSVNATTKDMLEALTAFAEKRAPSFEGR
jgi:2-(1,2-epoxy-1,2-dihydrophenyl)acetyl-CoA isomerase